MFLLILTGYICGQLAIEMNLRDNYYLRPFYGRKIHQKSCDNGAIDLYNR